MATRSFWSIFGQKLQIYQPYQIGRTEHPRKTKAYVSKTLKGWIIRQGQSNKQCPQKIRLQIRKLDNILLKKSWCLKIGKFPQRLRYWWPSSTLWRTSVKTIKGIQRLQSRTASLHYCYQCCSSWTRFPLNRCRYPSLAPKQCLALHPSFR